MQNDMDSKAFDFTRISHAAELCLKTVKTHNKYVEKSQQKQQQIIIKESCKKRKDQEPRSLVYKQFEAIGV